MPHLGKWLRYFAVAIMLQVSFISFAQTSHSINVGNGMLTFDVTLGSQTIQCGYFDNPYDVQFDTAEYNNFVYSEGSNVYTLNADSFQAETRGIAGECEEEPPQSSPNPTAIALPYGATISFRGDGRGNAFATISSLVDPLYKVVSILYATPGNNSSDGFTNTSTTGSVTTIGSNFQASVSESFNFGFTGGSVGLNFGAAVTTGRSDAFTETIANASSVGNVSAAGPNVISQGQDLFLIWLNPEVQLSDGSSATLDYSLGTPVNNGTAEPPDIVEVSGAVLKATNGVTTVPIDILKKQFNNVTNQYDLPGLAKICHDQSQYANNCSLGGQCGCTASDFADILNKDPLSSGDTTSDPYAANTSGSACASPTSSLSCRYVPVPATTGSPYQKTTLLSGPNCLGCNRPTNAFAQTDSTSTTRTFSESLSESVGYTVKAGLSIGPSFSSTTTFTWTDTESSGAINGIANAIQYSLSSSTVGCYQDVLIYEDTVFHTFVTRQAPGNTSCQ